MKRLFFLLLALSFSACLDKIDILVPKEIQESLVVQGGIYRYKNSMRAEVQLRMVSDEKSQSRTTRVEDAYVENNFGQKIQLLETGDGIYSADVPGWSDFNKEYGTKYRIVIQTLRNVVYMSSFNALIASPTIDRLQYKIVKKNIINQLGQYELADFVELDIDSKIKEENGTKYLLKYDIINSYKYTDQLLGLPPGKLCYVTQKADLINVLLYDARLSQDERLIEFPVYDRKIDYLFSEGYYGTVVQQAIDEEAYDYFTQINELNNREGTIYEPPAGRILTNIKNVTDTTQAAHGYFVAVAQDTARIYINPSELGNPKRQCPTPPSEFSICPIRSCCDCLILRGASLSKPHFWK